MRQTRYTVMKQTLSGCWDVYDEVYAYSGAEAVEQVANGETGEIGFTPRGAGRYRVVPASRVIELPVDETPSFRVRKEKE